MTKLLKHMDTRVDPGLYKEVSKFGAKDMEICMQCGNCSASCPLSKGSDSFPRKIYRYLQLGLRDKLLGSPEPWLCYYCGECNKDCPRGAEPAETMMAVRRWLTTQYDWTGLAKRLYLSEAWEIGALGVVSLAIILLFWFFHGPVITDHVSVNSFVPVIWIEIGDLAMAAVLTGFLMSNAFRMYRFIMRDIHVPLHLYITEAKAFVLHFATQKRWRECGEDRGRWLKHFILVTGYMTMMTLIMVFIRWFQVDDSSWHFSSIFGYYATGVLLCLTVEMFLSRLKKKEDIHRFSEPTDWLFLVLLFFTTLTGILMHIFRLAAWPMGTYVMYVIHLAIAVPMLVIEVPFGKWSHLFYRPLAIFLTTIKKKASEDSLMDLETIKAEVGETFLECMQCGTCSAVCPLGQTLSYSPRRMLRQLALNLGTRQTLDQAVWTCVTCNECGVNCPRGIDIIEVMRAMRGKNIENKKIPEHARLPFLSLEQNNNPWNKPHEKRMDWADNMEIPVFRPEDEYCLFTCCTTAYETGFFQPSARPDAKFAAKPDAKPGQILPGLLRQADVLFGSLGTKEICCGDPAHILGNTDLFSQFMEKNTDLFLKNGIKKIITTSPHCLDTFKKYYPGLNGSIVIEHYTQVLDRLIIEKRLRPTLEINCIATFHDPCYLGRHNGIFEAPRRILKSIPGVTLIEMSSNKEKSLCCGGGGGGAWKSLPMEEQLGVLRIQEALASGADVIATACPFCIGMLNEAIHALGVENQIIVRDLAAMLFESLEAINTPLLVNSGTDQEVYHV